MKKAIMYGAGNIGRGFIGQVFCNSGYEVVFIDINQTVIDKLNQDRCYPVRVVSRDGFQEMIVRNVRAVSAAEPEKVAEEIAGADIMATAVGVNVLNRIASPIAAGLKKRWESGNFIPLNIIICENLIDANHYLSGLIRERLEENYLAAFDERVGLVEASIGRMVPVMTPEMQEGNLLRVWVEPYNTLPVDKDAFRGEIPQLANMVPSSPFDFYIRRKIYMHNMGHALTAYFGFLGGRTFIWEAYAEPANKFIALRALSESAIAMSRRYNKPLTDLLEHADDLLFRFGNKLLGDTVERVGKDTIRKLSSNDRLAGAAVMCLANDVEPVYISLGIAAGLFFAPSADAAALEVSGYATKEGVFAALEKYSGLKNNNQVTQYAAMFYDLIKEGKSMGEIIDRAEILKNGASTR
ncbi:MAG: mannitol dehydrogenase [Clostridiales bacterium]|nr:mannitol dehydrogenase [Clostridiales bacterium]